MSSNDTKNPPLADYWSLCGGGYNPALEISIGDKPVESKDGEKEYRWHHKQYKRNHDRVFLKARPEGGWDLPT